MEEGLPKKRVLLWVYGDRLRAEFENVVLAEYRCRYDWKEHKVMDVQDPVFYPSSFISAQQRLIPLSEQEWITSVYQPRAPRRKRQSKELSEASWQLILFELVA